MFWLNNSKTTKSEAVTNFIHNAVLSRDFDKDDLIGFNAHWENQRLDKALSEASLRAQFSESSVDILVSSGDPSVPPKISTIPGLLYWKLTSIIHDAFMTPLHIFFTIHLSSYFIVIPSQKKRSGCMVNSISDAFHDEHEKL